MKHFNYCLLFFLFLFSIACKNNDNKTTKIPETVAKSTISSNLNYPTELHGFWINDAYLQRLQEGKMTLSAIQKIGITENDVTTFEISDSSASAGFNFHEGMACTLRYKDGSHFEVLNADNNYEKAYELEVTSKNHVKIGKTNMTKIGNDKSGVDALNFQLFGGKYSLNNKTVELKDDGSITGLEKYTHYAVLYDYISENNAPDQIEFITDDEVSTYFAFKLDKQTKTVLSIFDLKCLKKVGDDCLKSGIGKLHWTLEK